MKDLKVAVLVLIIAHMALIFSLSGQNGSASGELSKAVVEEQQKVTQKLSENGIDYGITYIDDFILKNVRSMAHCFLYSVLAILIFAELRLNGVSGLKAVIPVILICALYGVTDEFHQSFVPDREASFGDVAADALGASAGVVIGLFAEKIYKAIRK